MLHFLHWCYTWTALLSANQNQVFFSCILLKLKLMVFLAGHSVAMVTLSVTKIISRCLPMIGELFDTMIVASTDKEELQSFHPMSCSRGIVSPRVWSCFAPGLRVHTYTYVCGHLFRTRNIHTPFSPVLNPRAKQLHTPGELTLSRGETNPGEQDIGWSDLLP